jgi:membrane protein DedA with SNARE-associated domain
MFDVEGFLESVRQLDTVWIYLILIGSGFLENCIPPIPGDTVTVFAAYMVGIGRLNYVAVFLTATAGNLAGFMTMYEFGRFFGKPFFMKRNFRLFPAENIEKAETWFRKHGYRIILFNRFLSGLRSVISISAGMAGLKRRRVLPLAFLSACMWDGLLIYGGYVVGDNWKRFDYLMERYNVAIFLLIAMVALVMIARHLIVRRFKSL